MRDCKGSGDIIVLAAKALTLIGYLRNNLLNSNIEILYPEEMIERQLFCRNSFLCSHSNYLVDILLGNASTIAVNENCLVQFCSGGFPYMHI